MIYKSPFPIKKPIGDNRLTDPDDVIKVRNELHDQGYKDNNLDFGYVDTKLINNIKAFQKDNNLLPDGLINPDGPTVKVLFGEIPETADATSPTFRCARCGGWTGGSSGTNLCQWCINK